MRAISLAEAIRIIEGTFASAQRRNAYPLSAIVLDAGGRVKAFHKQDGSSLLRFEIAYGKAFAALSLNRSSRQVLQKAKEKPAFMQSLAELSDGPLFLEGGGQLIRDDAGEIVGALGVTGDVNAVDDAGFTPLMYAATIDFGDTATLSALLTAGADRTIRNASGRTPLQQARRFGHANLARTLAQP